MFKVLRQSKVILFSFLIATSISITVIYFVEQYNHQQKRSSIQKLSSSYVSLIRNNIFQALSAAYPLAALVHTQNGDVTGFTELATEMLPLYPGAASLQLQPGGIVKYVVPLKGNEGAIGHDLLSNPDRNKEAFLARDTGKLTFAGPFDLVQGGVGAVGRLPVYLKDIQGNKAFWGFSAVLFKFPEVLKTAKLERLMKAGIAYELSRVHPDTGKIQIISNSRQPLIERPEEFSIEVPNGMWSFKVSPIKSWRNESFLILEVLLGLMFSFLITFLALLIQRLRNSHHTLEKQVSERTQELTDNLKRLDFALNAAHQGWFELNIQTNEVLVSDNFPMLLGYQASKFNASLQEWQNNLHPEDQEVVLKSLKKCMELGEPLNIEYRMKTKGGGWLWLHSIGKVVAWDKHKNPLRMVGIHTDISKSKQQQRALELMAHYDVLTQLPNRELFADRFRLAIAHSKRTDTLLAICYLDLDNFKPVNDNYGHEVGDHLLIEVSWRIKANIREGDTASRQGGDEFTLLLGRLESPLQCENMLERLHNALAKPYIIDGHTIHISASSGVTLYPNDNADLDTLVRHADQAMYQSKLVGRNRYQLFNTEQDQQIVKKHHRLDEIQKALSDSEFCLYYQPKVNMKTGEVFGAEALIRWLHPEKGLIPPFEFLPIIENTALEILIGDWVINEALNQLDQWQKQGINIEVSVNISSFHLQSSLFYKDLEKALANHPNVDHKNFQLEILESSALGDLDTISRVTKACCDLLGVHIALDDFGTGYSSLTHLRSIPANTIKIDQSFVRDMLDDPSDYAIIDGVIGLADSFSREVIAEGVETTKHGLMLLIMGCDEAQGYGIARPMPAEELPAWLNNYKANEEWLAHGNKDHSVKEIKTKLLRLTTEQWYKNFENNILEAQSSDDKWAISGCTKCHIGHWIQREEQEQLFDKNWVKKLDDVHTLMHNTADNVLTTYQEGQISKAKDGLKEMRSTLELMTSVIGVSE